MSFVLILVIVFFAIELNKVNKENQELKMKLQKFENLPNNQKNNGIDILKSENEIDKQSINKTKHKKENHPEQTRNTLILITGAILIVLAAIVFLASTWNTIPDIIKTGTLVLLIGVFFGASYIAKNKFGLDLTSKTFYYIAMAYIPIVMFSISAFELMGYYLSISGDGNYIYFSACSIILTALYISEVIRHNKKVLLSFGLFFGVLATIFTTLIFTSDYYIIQCCVLLYLLTVYFITRWDKIGSFNLDKLKNNFIVLFIIATVITLIATFISRFMDDCGILDILSIGIITLIIYMMQKDQKNLRFLFNIGIIILAITVVNIKIVDLTANVKCLIVSLVSLIMYISYYINQRKWTDKLFAYISMSSLIFFSTLIFEINDFIDISFINTIIVLIVELFDRTEKIKPYLITLFIITFLTLNIETTYIDLVCIVCAMILFAVYVKKEKMSEFYMIIPILGIMPSIFSEYTSVISSEIIRMILCLAFIIASTGISVIKKHINVYLIPSIMFLILGAAVFDINKYVTLIMILAWAIAHIITYDKNDWFKIISYITGLAIYNEILSDLGIELYAIIPAVGYLACIYLITRTVIVKHIKGFKIIEYILTSLVFLYALNSYIGLADPMIFVGFLFILVVLAYAKKIGPLFLTSLVAIVINVLKLTKEFWQSIPWWVYMLVIGSALITFAMRNEIIEKTNRGKLKDALKRLKDNVDI